METFDAETLKTLAALERMAEPASSDVSRTTDERPDPSMPTSMYRMRSPCS